MVKPLIALRGHDARTLNYTITQRMQTWQRAFIWLLNVPFAPIVSNRWINRPGNFHCARIVPTAIHLQNHNSPMATIDLGFVYGSVRWKFKKKQGRNNKCITFQTMGSTRITHFRCKMAEELLAHKAASERTSKNKNEKINGNLENAWTIIVELTGGKTRCG